MITLCGTKDFTVLSVNKKCGGQGEVIGVFNVYAHKKVFISLKNKCCELAKLKSDFEGDPLILGLRKNINEGPRKWQKMVEVQ